MRLTSVIYTAGWQKDGSWNCPICKTMIGKNLLGEQPFALVTEHVEQHDEIDVMRTALDIRNK